jgi:ribosomal protein L11 methyltransferase
VLDRQAQDVIAAYAPYLELSVWAEHEGWVALAGRAPTE